MAMAMKVHGRLFCMLVLLALMVCLGPPETPASESVRQDEMMAVVNSVTIAGPRDAVFDLITTARFWPQWHPATLGVGGVTERPYGGGDRIFERGRIGTLDFQVVWKVVEYERPSHVVLQAEIPRARITYAFQVQDGATVFTRKVEYRREKSLPSTASPDEVDQLMQIQSAQAVDQLKGLVERILREEALGIP
jgi:uncharacterized protein YndB with AHSA1/START domain